MIGKTYLLRGVPVVVLARWAKNAPKGVPRNVLVKLPNGRFSVRPFRGLRLP